MKPIHRDDLPFEDAEEIVAKLQEMYPGFTVVFAGDSPDPEMAARTEAFLRELKASYDHSLEAGVCHRCRKHYPDGHAYPPSKGEKWPEGWGGLYDQGGDELAALECDDCEPPEGVPIPLNLQQEE